MHIPACAFTWLYQCPDLKHEEKSIFSAVLYLRPTSLADLSAKTGLGRHRVVRACRTLGERGWMRLIGVIKPLRPTCWIPRDYQERMAKELEAEYDVSPLGGEFLLGRLVEFWVDVPRCLNNARPSFLVNPLTGERLELDRFIPDIAGFEHNGTQHYAATEMFSSKAELSKLQARDLMKEALCRRHGIALVTVTFADLGVQRLRKLLPPSLPLHDVDLAEPYAVALEGLCSQYRRKAARSQKGSSSGERAREEAQAADTR